MLKLSNREVLGSWLDVQSPSVVSSDARSSLESWGMLVRRISIASSLLIFLVDLIPIIVSLVY